MGCGSSKSNTVVVIDAVKPPTPNKRTTEEGAKTTAAEKENGLTVRSPSAGPKKRVHGLEDDPKRLFMRDVSKEEVDSANRESERSMRPIGSIIAEDVALPDPNCGDGMVRQISARDPVGMAISGRMGTKSGYKIIKNMTKYNLGDTYDLLVMGAGPAGVKAAIEAAGRGVRVGLIDPKASITGAPTGAHSKCLREAVLSGAQTWEQVKEVAESATKSVLAATQRQLRTFLIEVMHGDGAVQSSSSISLTPANGDPPRELNFDTLVIATGSKSNRFPPVNFDLPGVYDSDTITSINRLPEHMVVQGAGIIGLEYALIFKKLGSKSVVVVDIFDKVVPMLDVSLQEACKETMRQEGIELVMQTKFTKVEAGQGSTEENPKIVIELEVDENGYTGVGKIYAVGDVVGGSLATVGQAMAVRAIRACYGSGMLKQEKGVRCKPFGVWTIPELAWAGLNEDQATQEGIPFGSVTVDFKRTVRGCVTSEEGFLKLIYNSLNGQVIGVHMCGENACDLINFGAEAVCDEDTVYDILQFVFPAVTYHELYHLAAAEAKLRIMHKGAHSLEAATAWQRVEIALEKSCKEEGKTVQAMLQSSFKYFDLDSSGYITPEQLKKSLRGLGLNFDDKQIMQMIIEATGSEDNENIDYEHFLRIFHVEPRAPGVGLEAEGQAKMAPPPAPEAVAVVA